MRVRRRRSSRCAATTGGRGLPRGSARVLGVFGCAVAVALVQASAAAAGSINFAAATNFRAGDGPHSVAVGDVNRDGKADLAVANGQSGDVSVLLGNGDGTFQAATNFAAHDGASSVAVADLNGDGRPDLAVANFGSADVSVLLGNGDGTFQAATNYGADGSPTSVAVADLNGD